MEYYHQWIYLYDVNHYYHFVLDSMRNDEQENENPVDGDDDAEMRMHLKESEIESDGGDGMSPN